MKADSLLLIYTTGFDSMGQLRNFGPLTVDGAPDGALITAISHQLITTENGVETRSVQFNLVRQGPGDPTDLRIIRPCVMGRLSQAPAGTIRILHMDEVSPDRPLDTVADFYGQLDCIETAYDSVRNPYQEEALFVERVPIPSGSLRLVYKARVNARA